MADLLFKSPQDYLQFEYDLRRARRPGYSMRAFARDLRVSPSSLNDFMKGRVGMSESRMISIAETLRWPEPRQEHFRDLILSKYDKDDGVRQASLTRVRSRLQQGSAGLSVDAFKAISEWYHLVILELIDHRESLNAHDIAEELNITALQATQALRRLRNLKLITKTAVGYAKTNDTNQFGNNTPSDAIRTFQHQILELAQRALTHVPIEQRESHTLIFSISKSDAAKMSSEITKAVSNIVNRYALEKKTNTIQALTLQVFPVWTEKTETPR